MKLHQTVHVIYAYIAIVICLIIILWKIVLGLHFSSMQKDIKQYLGDGKIEYVQAPPVFFSGFHDGIRIVFSELGESPSVTEYSLKNIPAGRIYHLSFCVTKETSFISKFPGYLRIEVFQNGKLSCVEDSKQTSLRNSYTTYNEFYFDSKNSSMIFKDKTDTENLLLRITYAGEKNIQPILQSGGEL